MCKDRHSMEGTALRLARVEDLDRVQELEELGTLTREGVGSASRSCGGLNGSV